MKKKKKKIPCTLLYSFSALKGEFYYKYCAVESKVPITKEELHLFISKHTQHTQTNVNPACKTCREMNPQLQRSAHL